MLRAQVLTLKDLLTPGEREFELLDPLDGDNGMGAEPLSASMGGGRNYLREKGERPPNVSRKKCRDVVRYRAGAGAPVYVCDLLPCVDGSGCGKRYLLRIQECWHRSWAFAYCVEDYCCTCCPCDLPRTQPVRGRLLVRISHFAEVQLRILEGYSLQGVDEAILYGKASSDPYCVVEYRGKKVLKTKYRSQNARPEVVRIR